MRTRTLALLGAATLAASTAAAADLRATAPGAPPSDVVARAEVMVARQSWTDAIAAYREAIAAQPNDAVLHNRLGICYQRAGDAKAARAAYRRAVDLKKDYAAAWNNLGTLDQARGKYKQALSAYGKAIKIDPKDAVFHKNLGSAWLARGDVDKALEAWAEALRLDPVALEADAMHVPGSGLTLARQYYFYAKVLAARGDVEHALEFLTKAQAAGFHDFAKVEADRDFATIVTDPRYAALK
jgi:tetratricopeptide (TPR) repeat protein